MPPPLVYRDLFVERPYAAALLPMHLPYRCSTCFKDDAKVACKRGCEVRYCNVKCLQDDREIHKYECRGLNLWYARGGIHGDPMARLLIRLFTRQLIDQGVPVNDLSIGFPTNIPNRNLCNLEHHQAEIESDRRQSDDMTAVLAHFRRAFQHTQLMNDLDLVRRLYCVIAINNFTVSTAFELGRQRQPLGYALYLNASRFDHSCRPDLEWHFDGANIVISYPSTAEGDKAVADERMEMTGTFNNLTVCYGYGDRHSRFPLPLRQERREALERSHYFTCQCSMCSDDQAKLELHAAALECGECDKPYLCKRSRRESCLTRMRTIECERSCDCSVISPWESSNFDDLHSNAEENLRELESEWQTIMKRKGYESAAEIMALCEPVWRKAFPLWHSTVNLRMHHLQEWMFKFYGGKIGSASRLQLTRGISLGMATIGWYDRYYFTNKPCYSRVKATYAERLADLFKAKMARPSSTLAGFEEDRASAAHWYRCAATIWRAYGKYAPGFSERLEAAAQDVENMSMVPPPAAALEVQVKEDEEVDEGQEHEEHAQDE